MPIDIVVPNLGESVSEATVASWLKKPGEAVAVDEPLVELETDKATLEMPSPKAGVLTEILVKAGEDVAVGAVLARLDESASAAEPAKDAKAESKAEPKEESKAKHKAEPKEESKTKHKAEAQTKEPESKPAGSDAELPKGTGPDGTVTLDDLLAYTGAGDVLEKSGPAVRKLILESGLDPAAITGTGRDGRITKEDVANALANPPAAPAAAPAEVSAGSEKKPREERVKMSRIRRTIAARMKEAQNTAAILTSFNEADMTEVVALRTKYKESFEKKHGVRLGFMSFFVKAAVAALKQIPEVNAEIQDDTVVYKNYYDIAMAVSSPDGLKVPVIRDCDTRSFAEVEQEIVRLAGRARDGSLTMDEMTGGTFTITNGGVFGSLVSTPILNRPQSAILGLHKIQDRPVAVDGEVVVRPMMYLALSYDHRLIDGREAVTFLVRVKEAIEDPERLLLDV